MFVLGDVPVDDTLYCPFDTFDSDGASVTITGLAVTDIEIYKNGSVTQRASDNGYALLDTDGIDFDGAVGLHGFSVDLSDNSDAGFYVAGSTYWINVNAITVDSQTVRFTYHFTIGKLLRPTTAGRTLDVTANGEAGLDLDNTSGTLDAAQLGADCITSAKIADDAFVAANFATGAFTADAFAADALVAATFATGAFTADAFAANALVAATFAADFLTAAKIADDAISSEHLNTGVLTADAFAADALIAATFATGALTADAFAADALVAATFAASSLDGKGDWNTVVPDAAGVAPTSAEITDDVWDEPLTGASHNGATTAGRRLRQANLGQAIADEGTAQAGGNNTITLADTAEDTIDDLYHEAWCSIVAGTGAGQVRFILSYVASTRVATIHAPWEVNPAADSEYVVHGNAASNLHAIQDETQSVTDFKDFVDAGYDPNTNKVQGVVLVDTTTTNTDMVGTDGANTTVPDVAGTAASLHSTTDGLVTTVDTVVDGIKAVTDNLPDSGALTTIGTDTARLTAARAAVLTDWINGGRLDLLLDAIIADLPNAPTKNTALANFPFLMVLTSDHVTGATGLTVTAQRSIDGGAYGNCANSVSEVGNGSYKISLAGSDLDGDTIMLKFTAATADARFIGIATQPT